MDSLSIYCFISLNRLKLVSQSSYLRDLHMCSTNGDLRVLCSFVFSILPVQNLPFIENMEKRIQSASLLLDASLGHCFVDGLEHRDANAIYNCLRAYASIDNTRSAEEIFRTAVVAPLIQKIIPHGPSAVATGSDELESDYLQIKECIEKECKFLLEISFEGIGVAILL